MVEKTDNIFHVGDKVIFETLHSDYGINNVIRVTKTQAILDSNERLPIEGVNGCHHLKNWRNKHMVHYRTYYRLPNDEVAKRANVKKDLTLNK